MSTFLSSLVARAADTGRTLQPRLPSVYEPLTGQATLPLFASPPEPDTETAALQPDTITPEPPPAASHTAETAVTNTTPAISHNQPQPPSIKPHRPTKAPPPEETGAKSPLLKPESKDTPLPPVIRPANLEEERPHPQVVEHTVEQRVENIEKGQERPPTEAPNLRLRHPSPPAASSDELIAQIREELQSLLATVDQRESTIVPHSGRPDLPPPAAENEDDKTRLQTGKIDQPLLANRSAAPVLQPGINGKSSEQDEITARGQQPKTRQLPTPRPAPNIQVMAPHLSELPPKQPPQAASEPEQTIEVRIGRIEVRAAPPPEENKSRNKKSKTAVMSLDDYLNRRNGKGNRA